jgi:hypothetical protein
MTAFKNTILGKIIHSAGNVVAGPVGALINPNRNKADEVIDVAAKGILTVVGVGAVASIAKNNGVGGSTEATGKTTVGSLLEGLGKATPLEEDNSSDLLNELGSENGILLLLGVLVILVLIIKK